MDLPRPRSSSPACSLASSLDSNGLPVCRIKCSREKILVGDQNYSSASDALLAYLRQFDGLSIGGNNKNGVSALFLNPSDENSVQSMYGSSIDGESVKSGVSSDLSGIGIDNKKDEVQTLLTSKVPPELKEEVTDTLREIKLKNLLKKAVSKSQKPGKTGLQQEVEAALARSAQLLEKVTKDDMQSTQTALSDISNISISTQLLLADAGSSANSNDSILSQDNINRSKLNGNINNDILNLSNLSSPDNGSISLDWQRSRTQHRIPISIDDLSLSLSSNVLPSSHQISLNAISNTSLKSPESFNRHSRSRSVPPPQRSKTNVPTSQLLKSVDELNKFGKNTVPNWVEGIERNATSPTNLTDNLINPVPIPQWVEDAAKSDISLDLLMENNKRTRLQLDSSHRSLNNSLPFSKSEGDLSNWNELSKLDTNNSSIPESNLYTSEKHVTFTDSQVVGNNLPQLFHSTPLRGHMRQRSPNANGILTSSPSKNNNDDLSDCDSDLKSSSFDTLALLTGKPHTRHKVADHNKGSILSAKLFPDSAVLSSIEQDRTMLSPSSSSSANGRLSSDGLDGDRSWEKHTNNFKLPVPVGFSDLSGKVDDSSGKAMKNSIPGLSGGNQPGSMETLKNMLFKLQKEESSVDSNHTDNKEHTDSDLPALQDYDFQTEPGGHSLEKALHHLDRLKTLVKSTTPNGQVEVTNGISDAS